MLNALRSYFGAWEHTKDSLRPFRLRVCFRGIEYLWKCLPACSMWLSYRAMTVQTGLIRACYPSVHYWVCKFKEVRVDAERKARRLVAIDETKLNGRHVFV